MLERSVGEVLEKSVGEECWRGVGEVAEECCREVWREVL